MEQWSFGTFANVVFSKRSPTTKECLFVFAAVLPETHSQASEKKRNSLSVHKEKQMQSNIKNVFFSVVIDSDSSSLFKYASFILIKDMVNVL